MASSRPHTLTSQQLLADIQDALQDIALHDPCAYRVHLHIRDAQVAVGKLAAALAQSDPTPLPPLSERLAGYVPTVLTPETPCNDPIAE